MKKLSIFILILALFAAFPSYAQKASKTTTAVYERTGGFGLNAGVNYFPRQRTTSVPIFVNPEVTAYENLTVGLHFMHMKYKHFLQDDTVSYYTEWSEEDAEIEYTLIFFGLKASYHLTGIIGDLIKKPMIKKYDLYVSGIAGYNATSAKGENANSDFEQTAFRGGVSVGGRYIYNKNFGFFMEYGFNSINHGSVGISVMF